MKNVSFRINIVDKISAGLKNIKGGFEKVAKAATTLQTHINNIDAINLSAAFDVLERISGHIESATEASMSFGQAMADLSSITGITGAELEELSAQSRKLGKESGLGADTAARAYSLLASQIDVAEIGIEGLNILQQKSITLAQASGMSLDAAADALAGTVNQFGLGADAADRVINVLAAGSKYGAAEIEHLTQSFKVVGSAASAMGLNVEETAGALEILSLANLKGSEAGTALRNIILKLNTELGVDLGEFSLGSALDALKPKLSDATYLAKVFGVENIAAAQFLIQNATAVDEMTTKLTGTAVAEEQAAIRTQTSAQRMAELRAQVEDLKISLADMGGSMTPYIALAAEHAEVLGMVGTATTKTIAMTQALNAAVKASTGATIAQNIALKAKLVASKAVTAATATWSAVQKGLNLILTANPIGLVVAAIGALVAGVIAAYNNCKWFRDICDAVWASVKTLATAVWNHLVKAFETVSGAIKKAWQWLKEFFGWDDEAVAEAAAVDKTTTAIDAQTAAVERNAQAKKGLAALNFADGGTPRGSMADIDKQIEGLQAKVKAKGGNALYHYDNVTPMASNDIRPTFGYSKGRWEEGAGSVGEAYLAWYSTSDRAEQSGTQGFSGNRQYIGLTTRDLYESFASLDDGQYIQLPPAGGWLEIVVYRNVEIWDFDNKTAARTDELKQYLRWWLVCWPKLDIIQRGATMHEPDKEDIIYTGTLDADARDPIELDTICGTSAKSMPTARGLYLRNDGTPLASLTRAGRTDSPEQLLIGTLHSQYATRHTTLTGTLHTTHIGRSLTYRDASMSDVRLTPTAETWDIQADEAEMTLVELTPDIYDKQ